jgi:predicted dehydrogenase
MMLDAEKPDAVCMVVPESLTCELACQVLERGYPLLMEKPPGKTTREIDRMIAAAEASGAPNQVALNRRYIPLARELVRLLDERSSPRDVQHVCYDFTRVGRADADFSLTAIHGIDMVRFLACSDYAQVHFHYQELPELGPTVANILMDCTLASGATAHLGFFPLAGVVVERATVHAHDHTFYLHLPVWGTFDTPGRLQHLEKGVLAYNITGLEVSDGDEAFEQMGFYAENASFFDDLRAGRHPAGDLKSARQSVEIAQCIRERKSTYRRRVIA